MIIPGYKSNNLTQSVVLQLSAGQRKQHIRMQEPSKKNKAQCISSFFFFNIKLNVFETLSSYSFFLQYIYHVIHNIWGDVQVLPFSRRHIGELTPKIIYFLHKKTLFWILILKTETLPPSISTGTASRLQASGYSKTGTSVNNTNVQLSG